MKMTYTFDSIAGYTQEKKELMALCDLFNNRKKYEKKGAHLPKGIIFYGDVGNGKTLFAKVLASECGLNTINIDLSESDKAYNICKQIKQAFTKGEKSDSPTMIFFDELDKVIPNEGEDYHSDREKTILSQLLTLIDGMQSGSNIIFVATCNNYNCIPESLVRPGRIDKKIGISKPDFESRKEILKMYMEKSSCKFDIDIDELSRLCSFVSSASLETLVNECILSSDENNFVSADLIKKKLYEIKEEDIPRKKSQFNEMLYACKNLGSFVVAKFFNDGDYTLSTDDSTVCNDYFNNILHDFDSSYDEDDDYDDDEYSDFDEDFDDANTNKEYSSKIDYINTITTLLGGYCAEALILNKLYSNMEWSFALIYIILSWMSKCGMLGLDNIYYELDSSYFPERKLERLYDIFDEIINDCYKVANEIVAKNINLIKRLMAVVSEKGDIRKNEAEVLIEEFGGIKF